MKKVVEYTQDIEVLGNYVVTIKGFCDGSKDLVNIVAKSKLFDKDHEIDLYDLKKSEPAEFYRLDKKIDELLERE